MRLLARALSGVRFGSDIVRATAHGVRENLRAPRPVVPADDEVHLLIEGDPARGLSPAARYRALQ